VWYVPRYRWLLAAGLPPVFHVLTLTRDVEAEAEAGSGSGGSG